uniref:Uncharacterized protein n=1 Tax=Anopheles dirus TaxID=7168 RepID=A0A182NFS7_9DIPT
MIRAVGVSRELLRASYGRNVRDGALLLPLSDADRVLAEEEEDAVAARLPWLARDPSRWSRWSFSRSSATDEEEEAILDEPYPPAVYPTNDDRRRGVYVPYADGTAVVVVLSYSTHPPVSQDRRSSGAGNRSVTVTTPSAAGYPTAEHDGGDGGDGGGGVVGVVGGA